MLALGDHLLRHRQQQGVGDWFITDLDWHDGLLWLLLLGEGRENSRVRLIHIITAGIETPGFAREERDLCGISWCAELVLYLSSQHLVEEMDAASYWHLLLYLGSLICLLVVFQVPLCCQEGGWTTCTSSFWGGEDTHWKQDNVVGRHLTQPVTYPCFWWCALHVC